MKGFYITIKNNLLDPKHVKAMGGNSGMATVWLFLWYVDKITFIDEIKGEGKVLGGKPIKYKDIKIFNCTQGSFIDAFERKNWAEIKDGSF